ncbi:MAG: NAD(P)H-dependent glycerol-3-phosphate dehydrogenase [Acidimicrobiia bacterium]|nr:NAD(P)H-dependent glycerol-3-phosphate dehydrogenase [Acidimicrobiia bacterium]
MSDEKPHVGVVGAGAWGTALAKLLADNGIPTRIWARESAVVESINAEKENAVFLSGIRLPESLSAEGDLAAVLRQSSVVVNAVPTQYIRSLYTGMDDAAADVELLVTVSKGIEIDTLQLPVEILRDSVPSLAGKGIVALSGPSFAREVAAGHPTAVVAAGEIEHAQQVQRLFSTDTFRVYTSDDIVSVELGGALKNVMAIAAGICDGLRFGHNTTTAVITRGLAEMSRLGVALGGDPLTFAGLSGMGDLVLTCTGGLSRNRMIGQEIGKGRKLAEILDGMDQVAEGVKTVVAVRELAKRTGIEMPIAEQVYLTLYENKSPTQVVQELMTRRLRQEK